MTKKMLTTTPASKNNFTTKLKTVTKQKPPFQTNTQHIVRIFVQNNLYNQACPKNDENNRSEAPCGPQFVMTSKGVANLHEPPNNDYAATELYFDP